MQLCFVYLCTLLPYFQDLVSYTHRHGIPNRSGSPTLPEIDVVRISTILLRTLDYLHRNNVAHRDLKPTNILLRDANNFESLVLVDFGSCFVVDVKDPNASADAILDTLQRESGATSRDSSYGSIGAGTSDDFSNVTVTNPSLRSNASTSTVNSTTTSHSSPAYLPDMRTITGTPFYLAPEMVTGQPYNAKVDIWSAGCLIFQLLYVTLPCTENQKNDQQGLDSSVFRFFSRYGITPFQNAGSFPELYGRIVRGDFTFPTDISPQPSSLARDFLRYLLTADPSSRPSAADALRHEWLSQHEAFAGRKTRSQSGAVVEFDHLTGRLVLKVPGFSYNGDEARD